MCLIPLTAGQVALSSGMRRLTLLLFTIALLGCREDPPSSQTRFALGTYVMIKVWDNEDSQQAIEAGFDRIKRVEELTTIYADSGKMGKLNRNGRVVSDRLAGVIEEALKVSRQSKGAYDPTVMPLMRLWGFYDTTGTQSKVPDSSLIEEALKNVDYRMIEVRGDTVITNTCRVDLSGMAKGYAVDEAVKMLKKHGIKKALVDAGGDIYCLGKKTNGWSIGIRDPRSDEKRKVLGVIKIDSGAVATSGDYENYFEIKGTRYHHLIDPETGFPARRVISATVIAPEAALADAWATALFITGKEGIETLNSIKGVEGLLILEDRSMIQTDKFPKLERL